MKLNMDYRAVIGGLFSLSVFSVVQGLTCYSCSYHENEIKRDYECVIDPANVTTANTVQCPDDSWCFTKVLYHKDTLEIRSITRGCGEQTSLDCGRNCCSSDIYWHTCLTECLSNNELCNDKDKSDYDTGGSRGPSDGSSRSSIPLFMIFTIFVSFILVF
ncbi:uncharacterized protein LOC125683685 [Ostrea edulis]|uniref:uncharacterized protein LOC125683685 n=1 Tax=Ostrea edulis TaxID=37623 RepID=UPI0024AFCAFB|nr:uncharacterized protein LOC125683685 [Ostrea edulis]